MPYEHLHITTWSYQWFKASVIKNYTMLSCKIHSFIAILNLRHEGYQLQKRIPFVIVSCKAS